MVRNTIPIAEQLRSDYTVGNWEHDMPKRIPQDWENLDRDLRAAVVSPAEIEAGTRRLLAEAQDTSSPRPASSEAHTARYRHRDEREHRAGFPDRAW